MSVLRGTLRLSVMVAFVALSSPALAKNFRWICTYPIVANPDGVSKQDFKLEFIADDVAQKAVVVGNAGMSDVDLHTGSLGVTLMEKLGSGVVQTTTIANGGISVHSRNTVTREGRFLASQSYGHCKLVQ
jgi:hypothetical protein